MCRISIDKYCFLRAYLYLNLHLVEHVSKGRPLWLQGLLAILRHAFR